VWKEDFADGQGEWVWEESPEPPAEEGNAEEKDENAGGNENMWAGEEQWPGVNE
jgi:hypothetical protein